MSNDLTFDSAKRHAEHIDKTAMEIWQRDRRLHAIVLSSVASAMQEHGPVDPERADRDAHDIALKAALLAVTRIVEEDAELKHARMERDAFRKLAEETISLSPMRPIVFPSP